MTAATCLQNATNIHIHMGSVLFLEPAVKQESTQFILHSQFNAVTNENNIAIIRLRTPIGDFTNELRAVLFTGLSQANNLFANEPALMSGYGVYQLGVYCPCA